MFIGLLNCWQNNVSKNNEYYNSKQRNIKLVKLPFKTTETEAEYADRVKAVFKSVHIFIYSDVEADVSVIRAKFNEWRKRL